MHVPITVLVISHRRRPFMWKLLLSNIQMTFQMALHYFIIVHSPVNSNKKNWLSNLFFPLLCISEGWCHVVPFLSKRTSSLSTHHLSIWHSASSQVCRFGMRLRSMCFFSCHLQIIFGCDSLPNFLFTFTYPYIVSVLTWQWRISDCLLSLEHFQELTFSLFMIF